MTDKHKQQPLDLDAQWNRCKHHLQKIYETPRSQFLKCKAGHKRNNIIEYPVFMVAKKEIAK